MERAGALSRRAWVSCGLVALLAAGCRDLALPVLEGDAGLPRGVHVTLLEPLPPTQGENVPQRTMVRLEASGPAGLAEVELSCSSAVLAQWRLAGETQVTLEREVDLGPCRPPSQQAAGVATVELWGTTVDATRVVSRHGPYALPVQFAAAPGSSGSTSGGFVLRMPTQLGPRMPLVVQVDSLIPLKAPPTVLADGLSLTLVRTQPLGEGVTRYVTSLPEGLLMEAGSSGGELLERTVLVEVAGRGVDGTVLQTVAPLKLTRVLWERLLPGQALRPQALTPEVVDEVMGPTATSAGVVLATTLFNGQVLPVRLNADTGALTELGPGFLGVGERVLGFDGLGATLVSLPDGGTPGTITLPTSDAGLDDPTPDAGLDIADAGTQHQLDGGLMELDAGVTSTAAPEVGASALAPVVEQSSIAGPVGLPFAPDIWQRSGMHLCLDTLTPPGPCAGYTLKCLDSSGGVVTLPTGLNLVRAPTVGGTSGPNALRLGLNTASQGCPSVYAGAALFGPPNAMRLLTGLPPGADEPPSFGVWGDGEGGFVLDTSSLVWRLTSDGELRQFDGWRAASGTPLTAVGDSDVLLRRQDQQGGAYQLELRDATGKNLLGQAVLSPALTPSLDPDNQVVAFLPDGSGVTLWREVLPGPPPQNEALVVVGFGPRLEGVWIYRYPTPVGSGAPATLVAEPGGRHVYLVDYTAGRVVALVR
ncbi:MAG: hypothetical protein L0Y66_08885 [Myxococcaceae bacterium]|nr:hypothetical protein [Myxococcaceae bacterium]MCI0673685.1 hypothetical protein [Myxococcaceae bacterium]